MDKSKGKILYVKRSILTLTVKLDMIMGYHTFSIYIRECFHLNVLRGSNQFLQCLSLVMPVLDFRSALGKHLVNSGEKIPHLSCPNQIHPGDLFEKTGTLGQITPQMLRKACVKQGSTSTSQQGLCNSNTTSKTLFCK